MNEQELQRRHDAIVAKSLREGLNEAEFGEWVDLSRKLYLWKSKQRKAEDED